VRAGARTLAEHVVGIAKLALMRRAAERLLDALAEYEMRSEQPHRLARRGAHRRQAQPLAEAFQDILRRLTWIDDARRETERPGRCGYQERARFHLMTRPV